MNPNPLIGPRGWARVRGAPLLLAALLLAGCGAPEPPPATPTRASVDPPADAGPLLDCPPAASQSIALAVRSRAVDESGGREAGLHRLGPDAFLWVWGHYNETLREDRVTRVNEVHVARAADGTVVVCTRVDLAAPIEVDAEPRSYDVAVLFESTSPLPAGPKRVFVNWVAGCPCDPLPQGHALAEYVDG